MAVRAVIFDCFGVLYGGSIDALLAMSPKDQVQVVKDLNKQSDYGFISGDEYVAGLAAALGKTPADILEILRQHHVRNEPLVEYVRSLNGSRRLGLLSNVSSGTMDRLFSPDERAELFDVVVLSYEESIAKPNPEIFTLIAERLGVPAGECVMVDDRAENCEGAEIAGMQSVQHSSNESTIAHLTRLFKEA